ncbi:hypothetical protein GQ457_14G024830 [Hibiscus cannabinus]
MEIVGQQHGSMQWPAPLHPSTVCSIREGVVNPVRHALIISHSVRSQMMAKHTEEALGLDIKPGSPNIFYSCGGDGLLTYTERFYTFSFQIDLRIYAPATRLFKCHSINDGLSILRILHVDHIAVDPMNLNIFAVAGLDKYNRLYDIRKSMRNGSIAFSQIIDHFYPPHLIGGDLAGVTGMAFSDQSELLVSYSDNSICLFTRDMGNGHDPYPFSPFSARSESSVKVISQLYKGSAEFESAKGVTFLGTKSEYVVMGSDFGRIFIWKKKGGELVRVMETDEDSVNFISLRMRSDKIDTIFIPFHNTDKLTSFLLPNKYSAIIGSHNHILRFGA